jgi:hypothetical protein
MRLIYILHGAKIASVRKNDIDKKTKEKYFFTDLQQNYMRS